MEQRNENTEDVDSLLEIKIRDIFHQLIYISCSSTIIKKRTTKRQGLDLIYLELVANCEYIIVRALDTNDDSIV